MGVAGDGVATLPGERHVGSGYPLEGSGCPDFHDPLQHVSIVDVDVLLDQRLVRCPLQCLAQVLVATLLAVHRHALSLDVDPPLHRFSHSLARRRINVGIEHGAI